MRRFRREIALCMLGVLATLVAFAVAPLWGWRVLGASVLATAALILYVAGGAYLMPGAKVGYRDGKAAFAIALVAVAMGLSLLTRADELARETCGAIPLFKCGSVCTNGEALAFPSPTRAVRAIRFVRSCDVPLQVTTHVSIVEVGQPLGGDPGNTLIVDGKADLVLLWIGGKHLAISGAGATPRLQRNYLNGVRISYDEPGR